MGLGFFAFPPMDIGAPFRAGAGFFALPPTDTGYFAGAGFGLGFPLPSSSVDGSVEGLLSTSPSANADKQMINMPMRKPRKGTIVEVPLPQMFRARDQSVVLTLPKLTKVVLRNLLLGSYWLLKKGKLLFLDRQFLSH
jgi:hypothetical protein